MKSVHQLYMNMSIMWKFSLLYTLLILIPIIIVGILSYRSFVSSAVEQADKEDLLRIQNYCQTINSVVVNTETMVEGIVFNSDTRTFMNSVYLFNETEKNHYTYLVQNELLSIRKMYPNQYYKIRFFSQNHSIGEIDDFLYEFEHLFYSTAYREIISEHVGNFWGDIKMVDIYTDKSTSYNEENKDIRVIPYYYKVYAYKTNDLIGIVEVNIIVDKILVNGYYNDHVLILKDNQQVFPEDNPRFDLTYNFSESDKKGIVKLSKDDKEYRVTYDTLESLDYRVLVIREMDGLLDAVNEYMKQLLIILFISIFMSFIVIYFVTKLMFRGFRTLVESIDRIRDGEFDIRLNATSGPEIRKLSTHFNLLMDDLKRMMDSLLEKEISQRNAEIKALQSQVNPHFLYNTLDSVRMQCEIREEYDIADVLISISRLFRYNTRWTDKTVTIQEEVDHTDNYMAIMKMRFEEKIVYEKDICNDIMEYKTMKMLLQPIVENCFKYAYNQKQEKWYLKIVGYIAKDGLYIEIQDNGSGISEEKVLELNDLLEDADSSVEKSSVGLWNLTRRIKVHYGSEYGLTITSVLGKGTSVIVKLPIIKD